jgi:hypothetical protein
MPYIRCQPERSFARFLRQAQSKDLRLHLGIYATSFWDTILAERLSAQQLREPAPRINEREPDLLGVA